ncbi:hypothetical protein BDV06DRAFT_182572 [Aspergillus oleicola]
MIRFRGEQIWFPASAKVNNRIQARIQNPFPGWPSTKARSPSWPGSLAHPALRACDLRFRAHADAPW